MTIFNSYVSLPEGTLNYKVPQQQHALHSGRQKDDNTNLHMFWGPIYSQWWYSIAMLRFQRAAFGPCPSHSL